MHREKRRNSGEFKPLMVGVLTILVVACILCTFYVGELRKTMEAETDRYLGEISQHVAALVNHRVETVFMAMDTAAANWDLTEDALLGYQRMENLAQRYGFERIGIIRPNGWMDTTDGYHRDLSSIKVVQSVLQEGRHRVTGIIDSPVDGEAGMMYIVPILKNGAVEGAMSATVGKEQLQVLLSVESFGGEGYSQIIDAQGRYVVSSGHKNAPQGAENFFELVEAEGVPLNGSSLAQMKADMAQGRPGSLSYIMSDGVSRTLCYVKLDVEDWYLLSVVPTAVTEAKSRPFIQQAVTLNAVIVALFLALTLIILWLERKSRRELEELALVDPVTGGRNRQCFEREAAAAISSAPSGTWVMVSMDIRHFKLINESFGSDMGNAVLKYVCGVIADHLEPYELVGRNGGDVFGMLLRRRSDEQLVAWLERLAQDINAYNEGRERQYLLSIAAGVYAVEDAGLDMIAIQDRANVARKKNGPARAGRLATCVFYSDVERLKLLREKEVDDRKEAALAGREFLIYLQPKVRLADGSLAGAEALVRWRDPVRGLVPPDEFIPLFERNGFVTKIDLFVFEEVCKLLRRWLNQGVEALPVSVNLSKVHLRNPDFLSQFQSILEWYAVPPQLIEFEFTETMAVEDLEGLGHVIGQLHDIGFRCALDDFGSGYSSLNILKDVPVDVLKLDRAFFGGGGVEDTRGRHIVESVVELARRLDMSTVSEGVETVQQVEFLRKAGCDMVQGFVFSRPVPVEEFERLAFGGAKGEKTE